MNNEDIDKLVDSIVNISSFLNLHPYIVINNVVGLVGDEVPKYKIVTCLRLELVKRRDKIPWPL